MRRILLCAVLVLGLGGCPGFLAALAHVTQGVQWLGAVLDAADAGQQAFFARHPNGESETLVRDLLRRAKLAEATLAGAAAAAKSAGDGDLETARTEALEAYAKLRAVLDELGVLDARSPPGGAETDAPKPEPVELPTADEVRVRLEV